MGKYKVYISSTYSDLKEHRQQVINFFEKKTIKENFDVVSMEGYVADNSIPAEECMEDVKASNIYILIIANRYGYIPPANNPLQLSITELEYNEAIADPQRTILSFFADETDPRFESDSDSDPAVRASKKQKLDAFKTRVRQSKMTSPEPFSATYQLALQIAESLMRRSFINYNLDVTRAYCCDRVPQFTQFLQFRSQGMFKTIVIYGDRKELGLNLINRFNIFAFDLPEDSIQNQLIGFEDFLASDDYEQNRNRLLVFMYSKFFPNTLPAAMSIEIFFDAFTSLTTPLVFVINCDSSLFEDNQLNFLKTFVAELATATARQTGMRLYLFVNIEDSSKSSVLNQQLKDITQIPGQDTHLTILPRLQSLSPQQLKTWLITYVVPNAGRAEEIMDTFFKDIPPMITMYDADKKMHDFIIAVNNNDARVCSLIN